MTIADALAEARVTEVDLSRYVAVPVGATIGGAVAAMTEAGVSCAFVVDDDRLAGIFTQRDVLMHVVGTPGACESPITAAMTSDPRTMLDTQSVGEGLHIMNELWVRSVPVIGAGGEIVGNLSYYPLMRLIADLLGQKALRTPTEVSVQHGMMFVDFTGLNFNQPVSVHAADTVATAVHQMRGRAIGSTLVVDDRDHLIGVLTEYDLQTKVACTVEDVEGIQVRDVMTPDPIALSVRAPIGQALQEMADHGFSHVPLLGESGRLVGVSSFRDVADYFETSLAVLS